MILPRTNVKLDSALDDAGFCKYYKKMRSPIFMDKASQSNKKRL